MATISVRVEDELKDRAEEVAGAEGVSVSEWTRNLMRVALGYESAEKTGPPSFSKRERHQLALLHRIIQITSDDADEAEYHGARIEILQEGYTAEYTDEFEYYYDELSPEDCRLVWDILEMFRLIDWSLEEHGASMIEELPDRAKYALKFSGFDFNDERERQFASYARHVIGQDRWVAMAPYFDREREFGNSHALMLDHYTAMLAVFRPIYQSLVHGQDRGRRFLNESELRRLVLAVYPEN